MAGTVLTDIEDNTRELNEKIEVDENSDLEVVIKNPTDVNGNIKTSLNNEHGEINVQNPLPCDGDSVYEKDIWVAQSNMNGFSGVITDLFDNLHTIVTDDTATEPKEILIHFNRTIPMLAIGVGAFSGDFSNLKVIGVTSGHVEVTLYDDSTNNTKKTSATIFTPSGGFNAIKLQCHTTDQVTLSNLFILKATTTLSRIQGQKPDGTFAEFQSTAAGNFKMSIEEFENAVSVNLNTQLRITPYHEDGIEGILISGVKYVSGKSGVDAVTEALETIDYPHHEIHSGNHYYIEGMITMSLAQELYVKLVTPDTTKWSHFLWEITSSDILETTLHEDVSGGMAGGAGVTPLNNNRNSANTSGIVITSGVAVATDMGETISQCKWGTKQAGGGQQREDEIILKQNATYLRRIVSGANGNLVCFKASWYEHTNKN